MGYNFKEGDIVRVRFRCSGCIPGIDYVLRTIRRNCLMAVNISRISWGCTCRHNWILMGAKYNLTLNTVHTLF